MEGALLLRPQEELSNIGIVETNFDYTDLAGLYGDATILATVNSYRVYFTLGVNDRPVRGRPYS